MELSIIVPIYNVEQYVHACLESIFRQGIEKNRFEVILVNDGTKDKSMEAVADIIASHPNITIINQENQGLSLARNNGLAVAKGEYILFVDSDDMLVDNSLNPLLECAMASRADFVMADYHEIKDAVFGSSPLPSMPERMETIEKSAEQMYLEDLAPWACYVFRTLYRKAFLDENNIRFIPGITYEDQPFTHECFLKAKKCLRAPWPFYVYRVNRQAAITSSFNTKKAKDMCISIAKSWELTHLQGTDPRMILKLKDNIFSHFKIMTLLLVHNISDASDRLRIIDFLQEKVPDMRFSHGHKQRVVSFLFQKFPHCFIRLKYWYGKYWENSLLPLYHHKIKRIFRRHSQ